MQNVAIRKASELSEAERTALEQLLGRAIAPDEEISIIAAPRREIAPSESRAAAARKLESFLNRRAEKVNGVSEQEIDAAIDEAIDHVRHSRS